MNNSLILASVVLLGGCGIAEQNRSPRETQSSGGSSSGGEASGGTSAGGTSSGGASSGGAPSGGAGGAPSAGGGQPVEDECPSYTSFEKVLVDHAVSDDSAETPYTLDVPAAWESPRMIVFVRMLDGGSSCNAYATAQSGDPVLVGSSSSGADGEFAGQLPLTPGEVSIEIETGAGCVVEELAVQVFESTVLSDCGQKLFFSLTSSEVFN